MRPATFDVLEGTLQNTPLHHVDQWDDFVKTRYQPGKSHAEFRNYRADAQPGVAEFYRLNHKHQTLDLVRQKQAEWLPLRRANMSMLDAMQFLNTLVDDSDPDTDLSQIEHLLQTSEAMRADGQPRWFILTGLIHDLGKVLCLWGEPQWFVVGDTFPVGCAWSPEIVYPEYFADNPDSHDPRYNSQLGIYSANCGLENVNLSWGHDEYLYHVTRSYLPLPAQYMIRYHSFYSGHRHGAYEYLMNAQDREMFEWVRKFNPYDLYSKGSAKPDWKELRAYYEVLIAEFFPQTLQW